MSTRLPAYSIQQLAPGSFDVLLDGTPVAALLHGIDGLDDGWQVDLLDVKLFSDRPPPFTVQSHTFRSLPAVLDWLGIHERGIVDARSG